MKNKILLPIALLASLVLAGCNQPKPSSSTPASEPSQTTSIVDSSEPASSESSETIQYGVAITNKDELTADWAVGGAARSMSIALTPEANPLMEIQAGNLVITSDHPEVISVTGVSLAAKRGGSATITVSYHEKTDSVTISTTGITTKYGVDHEGSLDDPLTNEEALKIAKDEHYDNEDLYVQGVIDAWYHEPIEQHKDGACFYLKPATDGGERFEIYKLFTEDGEKLADGDLWLGGTVLCHGTFTVYNGQYETSSAKFVSCTGGEKPGARTTVEKTFAEVLTANAALADGSNSYDYYKFEGYVTSNTGSNYFLTATKGEALDEQTSDAAHGSKKYFANSFEIYGASDELAALLLKNAKVEVTAIVKNYHGQAENLLALSVNDVTVKEAGEPWVVETIKKTVAEGLTVVNALEDNATTKELYEFTAFVKSVTTAYNDTYGNMSFLIADAMDDANTITVFRAKTDATTAEKVKAGAKVTIYGNLQKYVKDTTTTPELINVTKIVIAEEAPVVPPVVINYGTLAEPLTIAQVKAELDKLNGEMSTEHFFVKGYVYSQTAMSTTEAGATRGTIWLTNDDGTEAQSFEVYACYGGENEYAAGELVGKLVTFEGLGIYYNSTTYELTSKKISSGPDVYDNPKVVAVDDTHPRAITSVEFDPSTNVEVEQGKQTSVAATIKPYAATGTVQYTVSGTGVSYTDGKLVAEAGAATGERTLTAKVNETTVGTLTFTVTEAQGGGGPAQTTVNFSAEDLIDDPSAAYTGGSVKLTSHAIDAVLTASISATDGNSGKIYKDNTNGFQIRLYNSGSGKFVITAADGYEIVSATVVAANKGSQWWVAGSETAMEIAAGGASCSYGGSGDKVVYTATVTYQAK